MRQIGKWRRSFNAQMEPHYRPVGEQPSITRLMDIELGLYLLATVAPGQSAGGLPALLDGYGAVHDAVAELPADAASRIGNARVLLWRKDRRYSWGDDLRTYNSVADHLRGFALDELDRPVQRPECRVAPDRWSMFEEILTHPLPFEPTSVRLAEPGTYRMSSTSRGESVVIPDDIPLPNRPHDHDVRIRPRGPINVSWSELLTTARAMDAADASLGLSNGWKGRLEEVRLETRTDDDTFIAASQLTIEDILHVVGMVSVGKTTLVIVLSVWAARNGYNITIVLGDNSTAIRTAHDLSRYDGVRAAPIMGLNRQRHAERLHRLQPAPHGRVAPHRPFGFELVSTACCVNGLRDSPAPLTIRESPCEQKLIAFDPDEPPDRWRTKRNGYTCPFWHGCQRHETARRLIDANIWIATPWSLVHTRLPGPLTDSRMHYFEAAWRRSDLVIVDEADQVQANLDEMFANAQVLFGPSDEAWIDELDERVHAKLRSDGHAPNRSKQIRRFTTALEHGRTVGTIIFQLLQRDRARSGQPVLNWIDKDYFTSWSLFDRLALDWSGCRSSDRRKPAEGWESDPVYLLLRDGFNAFIDGTTDATEGISGELASLARAQLSDTEEDSREERVRQWLGELGEREITPGRKIATTGDEDVWRLELAVAIAVLAHRLNRLLAMWPQAAAELDMYDTITTELRRPPTDPTVLVPESPMGNVLGFQYVEEDSSESDGKLGEFRFFRYSGVGRSLLVDMPDLYPADGRGPNVLLLSGTSWAGTSPRYHIDVPVRAILRPSADKLAEIAKTKFWLDLQYTGDTTRAIQISGRYGSRRRSSLREMVSALTRPGSGPDGANRLERERRNLPPKRQKVMLLVGSYAEARLVTEALLRAKPSWKGMIRCLVGDDELETGWEDAHLRRGDVPDFGHDPTAWLLVAPALAVERGHNILNDDGVAAIGAAFFLVRPHPRPKDLGYITQRINQYALQQRRSHHPAECEPAMRLEASGRKRRVSALREWRTLLHATVAYSLLGDEERARVAWTQLVTIWQVTGRLLRGGKAGRIYFCDAAFAPVTAERRDGELDDAGTSLLLGMRDVLEPYFEQTSGHADRHLVKALYDPLYQALSTMGER